MAESKMKNLFYFYREYRTALFDLVFGVELEIMNENHYPSVFVEIFASGAMPETSQAREFFLRANDFSGLSKAEINFLMEYSERVFAAFRMDLAHYLQGDFLILYSWPVKEELLPPFAREVFHFLRHYEILNGARIWQYGEIASWMERPGYQRAVGRAMALNPFPLLLPCHRVVPKAGGLGNYGPGRQIKEALLRHEGLYIS